MEGAGYMLKRQILLAAAGSCLSIATLEAQHMPRPRLADSAAVAILALEKDVANLSVILRQVGGAQPRAKLDELADSLAQRAILTGPNMPVPEINVLRTAGLRGQRASEDVPYVGALDRLIRIHRYAPVSPPSRRTEALFAINAVVGFDRAVTYLFSVATSADPTAVSAMWALESDATPASGMHLSPAEMEHVRLMLRRLWDKVETHPIVPTRSSPEVPDQMAFAALSQFARKQGWMK
jgi:hypothetical protein